MADTITAPAPARSEASSAGRPAVGADFAGIRRVPHPVNEPVRAYAPGSPEKLDLKARLKTMAAERLDIPLVIGGEEVRTGQTFQAVHAARPRARAGRLPQGADPPRVARAIEAAAEARREWSSWRWEDRAAIFLKAAELLAGPWRSTLNAATMLGQSKTVFQAEIDSACEVIDFWRFNPHFAQELYGEQPLSRPGVWNQLEYRPLEGFVYAITPFNFTAIAANLPTAPALMGNTVVWKPAASAVLSALLRDEAAAGGGAAAGRHQLRARRRGRRSRTPCSRTRTWPACTSPAPRTSSTACGRRSAPTWRATAPTRASSARRAARTSSSPTRPPIRGRGRGRHRARRVRVPGPEVLGRQPRLRAALAVARRARSRGGDDPRDQGRRRARTSGTSWAP